MGSSYFPPLRNGYHQTGTGMNGDSPSRPMMPRSGAVPMDATPIGTGLRSQLTHRVRSSDGQVQDLMPHDNLEPDANQENPDNLKEGVCISPDVGDREDLVERCRNVFYRYRDDGMRTQMLNMWMRIVRAYEGQKPTRSQQYRTIYILRELFKQFHTILPLVTKQFLGGDELFEYQPRHPGEEDDMAAATSIVHYQIKKYHQDRELYKWIQCALLKGTSYVVPSWRKFKHCTWKPFPLHDPKKDNKEWYKRPSDEVEYGTPWMEYVPPEECYCEGRVEDPRESPYFFIQKIVSLADLKTLVREGYLDKKAVSTAENIGNNAMAVEYLNSYRTDSYMWSDNFVGGDEEGGASLQELVICYSNSGYEYVMLNPTGASGTLVRAMPLSRQGIPVLCHRNYTPLDKHWGIPELYPVEDDQRLLNDLTSMWADSVHFDNVGMWVANADGQKALANFNFRPGAVMKVNKLDDVRRVEQSGVPQQLGQDIATLRNWMQSVTGATDTLAGTAPNTGTATMGTKLQQAASNRIADKVTNMMPMFSDAYQWMFQLNAQFLDRRVMFRLEGQAGKNAFFNKGPNVFGGDPDVTVKLADLLETSPERVSALLTVGKVFLGNPIINQPAFCLEILRAMGGQMAKQSKRFLNDPATAQADAMTEFENWLGTGAIPDPNMSEDFEQHSRMHHMQAQTVEFHSQDPIWQNHFMRHIMLTDGYLAKQQQAQARSQMMPEGNQQPQIGNATANAVTQAPQAGASQQGEIAGPQQ